MLTDMQLSGWIPSEIGKINRLTRFSSNNNFLTGSLPSQLGLLIELTTFELQSNIFRGTIPNEFARLNAAIVNIDFNNFLRVEENQSGTCAVLYSCTGASISSSQCAQCYQFRTIEVTLQD
eukprot:c20760_g2_i1.p1 GENE.c20760_g2_i1~~c20760_g2_i1.p1  ORF type:complete len:133 (+),score=32.27 c20760_g2_i1:39-401(+)